MLEKLQRVTTSKKVIPEIDGLRFLAIISVVIFHLRTHLIRTTPYNLTFEDFTKNIYDIISNGGFGVNVFFGISGFILALPFAEQHISDGRKVSIREYYFRRLTRLEPPYFIIMTILLIGSILLNKSSFGSLLPHYSASLIYSHFFIYGNWSTINPVAWSLETEVQFYLLAPLIFMIFKLAHKYLRRFFIIFLLLLFTLIYFRFNSIFINLHLYKSLLVYFPYFGVGMLFADYFLEHIKDRNIKKSNLWDGIGVTATIIAFWLNPNDNEIFALISLISLFVIFISIFKGKYLNHFYSQKFIYITGGMCYTIYLIHYAFIAVVMDYTSNIGFNGSFLLNLLLQSIIILPFLYLVSAVSFLLFEKPFMDKNWPSKLIQFLK